MTHPYLALYDITIFRPVEEEGGGGGCSMCATGYFNR